MDYKNLKGNEPIEVKNWTVAKEVNISSEPRTATFVISAENVDDEKEVVKLTGMSIKDIQDGKRRVAWMAHDKNKEAALITGIERTDKYLIASVKFPDRPDDLPAVESWEPDVCFAKARAGFYGASIDFMSEERRVATRKDLEEFGSNCKYVHAKSNLLGFSFTSIPANKECMMLACKALKDNKIEEEDIELIGLDKEEVLKEVENIVEKEVPVEDILTTGREDVADIDKKEPIDAASNADIYQTPEQVIAEANPDHNYDQGSEEDVEATEDEEGVALRRGLQRGGEIISPPPEKPVVEQAEDILKELNKSNENKPSQRDLVKKAISDEVQKRICRKLGIIWAEDLEKKFHKNI